MQETTKPNLIEDLTEGWFVPFSGSRKYAHYLKNDTWLCGAKNWIPAMPIRPLMKNITLPHCKTCQKKLFSVSFPSDQHIVIG